MIEMANAINHFEGRWSYLRVTSKAEPERIEKLEKYHGKHLICHKSLGQTTRSI